ncbi:Aminoglycoside phosphotransferase [Niveomyces insectorum RCEF 264]|uniref:Aminoglycoside phosphotransferase n=1 Tax=Niveomyces insectorum RCEF 264 TaxID=1081102 RepID=A0A167W763_9HYPO|nr:Aminoglycoside phosphotransferase [Niveomyces insectorum RCEF 264]
MATVQKRISMFAPASFNLEELLLLAGSLRGQPCHCDRSQRNKSGSMNWAIALTFEDNVEWIFRSPQQTYHSPSSFDDTYIAKIIASEVATIRHIREQTSVPVAEVFAFRYSREVLKRDGNGDKLVADLMSPTKDNKVGVPYILQSKAVGTCLLDYSFREMRGQPGLSEEQRADILRQLGVITQQLAQIRFSGIGSLVPNRDDPGECLSPGLTWNGRHALGELARGPFKNDVEYYCALATALKRHAMELPMDLHMLRAPIPEEAEYSTTAAFRAACRRWDEFVVVGCKTEDSRNRFDYCLTAELLQDTAIPQMLWPSERSGFALKHPDLHVGNLFVDDSLKITCIIDWSCATTVPDVELLSAPRLWGVNAAHSTAFREGLTLSAACMSSPGSPGFLATGQDDHIWAAAERVRLFQRLVRFCSVRDYDYLDELFVRLDSSVSAITPSTSSVADELWRRMQTPQSQPLRAKLQEEDMSPEEIANIEQGYYTEAFWRGETEHLAVARKLALMWHMNPRFVADCRLWRWLNAALGPDNDDEAEDGYVMKADPK